MDFRERFRGRTNFVTKTGHLGQDGNQLSSRGTNIMSAGDQLLTNSHFNIRKIQPCRNFENNFQREKSHFRGFAKSRKLPKDRITQRKAPGDTQSSQRNITSSGDPGAAIPIIGMSSGEPMVVSS